MNTAIQRHDHPFVPARRRGIDRFNRTWEESQTGGPWFCADDITQSACPSLTLLLADFGPLQIIDDPAARKAGTR